MNSLEVKDLDVFNRGLIIRHDDTDGVGCEILAKIYCPNKFDYVECKAGKVDPILKKYLIEGSYDLIIVADLSFDKEETLNLVKKYIEAGNQFYLVDHHKNAMKYDGYDWAYVSIEVDGLKNSGTELLNRFFTEKIGIKDNKALIDFVELVRAYDTWDWFASNNIDAKNLVELFEYNKELFIEDMISKILNNKEIINDNDRVKLEIISQVNKNYINKTSEEIEIFNYEGKHIALVVANQLQGFIANKIFELNPEVQLIVFIVSPKVISLRSTDDRMNAFEIAKRNGGGGHRNACGYTLNDKLYNHIINNILG